MFVRVMYLSLAGGAALLLFMSAPAQAATIPAAVCSSSAVQAAINAAATGDTVTVPAGSCTWSSAVSIPSGKNITLQGAGMNSTVISSSPGTTAIALEYGSSRITGFTFGCGHIRIDGKNWRIDHSKFSCASFQEGVFVRGMQPTAIPTGLVDHNTFVNQRVLVYGYPGVGNEIVGTTQWFGPLGLGTDQAVYVEDNTFAFDAFGNAVDCNYGGAYVFRHNNVTDVYLEAHSVQGYHRACRKWEVYNNSLRQATRAMYFPMFIRGGTGVVFNNAMTGTWGSAPNIVIDNIRSFESVPSLGKCEGSSPWDGNAAGQSGWPCRDQIGRGGDISALSLNSPYPAQSSDPAYFWGNTFNGSAAGVQVNNGAGIHLKPARDYFVNQGPKPGYAPFTYPHPLQSDGSGSTSSGPSAPTNLRIMS